MLAVSAAAEFLRCTEAAHLVCTCKAFNDDPGLRDRTTAGSRRAERAHDAVARAAALRREQELIQLWREHEIHFELGEDGRWHERSAPSPTLARALLRARRESRQFYMDVDGHWHERVVPSSRLHESEGFEIFGLQKVRWINFGEKSDVGESDVTVLAASAET